jgi:hypothetical protein
MEYLFNEITEACLRASVEHIPSKPNQRYRVIPGWNEIVSEHKRNTIFWHIIWKANGSPRNGILILGAERALSTTFQLEMQEKPTNKIQPIG